MTAEAHPGDKAGWRAWAAERRTGSTGSSGSTGSTGSIDHAAVVAGLRAFLAVVAADGWVLTYRPMPGEVDLDALLADGRCAVTRTERGRLLSVHPAAAPTERHRLGYLQPVADAPLVPLDGIVAALVPGVLFDRWGTRLGHGAGHYDRLQSERRTQCGG